MNKQIEEMAKDIYEQKSCDTSFEENCKLLAYDLVTLGYQKVNKDSVILTKAELNQIQANFFDSGIKYSSKETASEILKWLKEHCDFVGFGIAETYFKEQYGVEIKND